MSKSTEEAQIAAAIRSGTASSLTRFRVTLVCSCEGDAAYGYGPTIEAAEGYARAAFKRGHPGRRPRVSERVVEEALDSHYEEITP